ncbi:MAG: folylpolyglutamate synthase/dihydrofolate synthase family protein [Anaerovoracaceae bacterium]
MNKAIEKIAEFQRFGSVLGLERIEALLSKLGNPHESLKVIHVAGTNGKGSVCKYLEEALRANGYKVGLYTSPFIETFNERIVFDGACISDKDLEATTEEVLAAAQAMVSEGMDSPTEFEVVTAVALLYYQRKCPDFVILEVGLGGRGDSTNVIKQPLMSIITSISYDHMDRLGNTLEEIAGEKAGIIKEGCPVVCNVDKPEAAKVIAKEAYNKGSVLYDVSKIKQPICVPTREGEVFSVDILGTHYNEVKISMVGEHQVSNAITALTAIEILRKNSIIKVEKSLLYKGLFAAFQMGRIEILGDHPVYVLDGAHNEEGMESLVNTMDTIFREKKILIIIGLLQDKAVEEILNLAAFLGDQFIVTEPDNLRKLSAEVLAEMLRKRGKQCRVQKDPERAFMLAKEEFADAEVILCTGSLYLIGELRRTIKNGGYLCEKKEGTVVL